MDDKLVRAPFAAAAALAQTAVRVFSLLVLSSPLRETVPCSCFVGQPHAQHLCCLCHYLHQRVVTFQAASYFQRLFFPRFPCSNNSFTSDGPVCVFPQQRGAQPVLSCGALAPSPLAQMSFGCASLSCLEGADCRVASDITLHVSVTHTCTSGLSGVFGAERNPPFGVIGFPLTCLFPFHPECLGGRG